MPNRTKSGNQCAREGEWPWSLIYHRAMKRWQLSPRTCSPWQGYRPKCFAGSMAPATDHFPSISAVAKSFQSCPTLCYPIDGSPPGFPVPGILQARTLVLIFDICFYQHIFVLLIYHPFGCFYFLFFSDSHWIDQLFSTTHQPFMPPGISKLSLYFNSFNR